VFIVRPTGSAALFGARSNVESFLLREESREKIIREEKREDRRQNKIK
jgi:hypothetical protein